MISVFYGDDADARRDAVSLFIKNITSDHETLVAQFDDSNWSPRTIMSYSESQGLFATTYVVVLNQVLEDKDKFAFVQESLDLLVSSKNYFIFVESKMNKDILKPFEKAKADIKKFQLEKKPKVSSNAFALADAFANKDKKNAWVLFTNAMAREESPEAIAGMLFWKIKTMIVSGRTRPFEKAELQQCSRDLIGLYHAARRENGAELSVLLEQFILRALS